MLLGCRVKLERDTIEPEVAVSLWEDPTFSNTLIGPHLMIRARKVCPEAMLGAMIIG